MNLLNPYRFASSGPTNPGTADLVSWWAMDGTGTLPIAIPDEHGTNTGNTTASQVVSVNGMQGTALDFTGVNGYAAISASPSMDLAQGTWTVNLWYRFEGADMSTTTYPMISKGIYGSGGEWFFALKAGTTYNGCYFRRRNATSGAINLQPDTDISTQIEDGNFHMFTATDDGTTARLYVDGVEVGSRASWTFTDVQNTTLLFTRYSSLYTLGTIDETCIYDRALTANEIEWLYNGGQGKSYADVAYDNPGTTGLEGYWSIAADYPDPVLTVEDKHTTGRDLTTVGSPVRRTGSVKWGPATADLGAADYFYSADSGLAITGAITVGGWFLQDSISAVESVPLIGKYDSTGDNRSFLIYRSSSSGFFRFAISHNGEATAGGGFHYAEATTDLQTATWYHVVGVFRPGEAVEIWIDGVKEDEDTTDIGTTLYDSSENFEIGTFAAGSTFMNGIAQMCFAYSRDLSADEISWLYNNGMGRVYPEILAPTYIIAETCEGIGTPTGWTDSDASVDWDAYTGVMMGLQKLVIPAGEHTEYSISNSENYEVVVAYYNTSAFKTGTTAIAGLRTAAGTPRCLVGIDSSDKLVVYVDGAWSGTVTDGMADNTTYWIKMIWNNQGTCSVEFCEDGVWQGSGTKYISTTATNDYTDIGLLRLGISTTTYDMSLDNIILSDSEIVDTPILS